MDASAPQDSPSDRNEVWADVRGKTFHGVYSVSADGNWVEVIADDGRYKTGAIGDSTAEEVAERLLRELYARGSGAIDD
jgi:hypothetical protein